MNYLDFNDDINESSNIQPTTSVVVNQQNKDLSDWRNIQLGTTPTIFDRFWMPTTVNPWTTPIYPSPYNQQIPSTYQWTNSNNNQSWPMTNFPTNTGLPLINFNSTDTTNDIIDLTINNTVNPSTPIRLDKKKTTLMMSFFHFRDFIPVQPNPYTYPNPIFQPTTPTPEHTVTEAELILVPEIDIEEILGQVEAVIPDIDIDVARRTITAMNPIPSTNDIVTNFLDNGYTRKLKKSSDYDRHMSLKRSWSEIIDDIPKFLSSYSDPINYFFDIQRKQSELYINHAKAFLLRAFPTTDKSILEQTLQEENYHFLPTIRKLETRLSIRTNAFLQRTAIRKSIDMLGMLLKIYLIININHFFLLDLSVGGVGRMPSASWLIKNNKFAYAIPHTPCEEFYDELRFAKNEVKIRRKILMNFVEK
jgi:hypothetical protein